jgi:hypothetical protein
MKQQTGNQDHRIYKAIVSLKIPLEEVKCRRFKVDGTTLLFTIGMKATNPNMNTHMSLVQQHEF